MSDFFNLLVFFGIMFLLLLMYLTKDKINLFRKFLETPEQKLYRKYVNGEISEEEYLKKMEYLKACG